TQRSIMTLACDLDAVRPAAFAARKELAALGASEADLIACELALVEACNNAILYATEIGRQEPVEIQFLRQQSDLEMQVIDHTPGFDWPSNPQLPSPEAERGRGLFIIRSL